QEDDIVKIARSCPLVEGSGLLGEELGERVCAHLGAIGEIIRVGMEDRAPRGFVVYWLVPRDIEQQTRCGRHAERAAVSDLPLERYAPLPVDTFPDRDHFNGKVDSAEVGCPLRDFPEVLAIVVDRAPGGAVRGELRDRG